MTLFGYFFVLQSMLHASPASIYGQEAFRHLLWVERKESCAGRPLAAVAAGQLEQFQEQ